MLAKSQVDANVGGVVGLKEGAIASRAVTGFEQGAVLTQMNTTGIQQGGVQTKATGIEKGGVVMDFGGLASLLPIFVLVFALLIAFLAHTLAHAPRDSLMAATLPTILSNVTGGAALVLVLVMIIPFVMMRAEHQKMKQDLQKMSHEDLQKTSHEDLQKLKQDLQKMQEQGLQSHLPIGTIVLFRGARFGVPSGWRVCDGGEGTPDLRNRFVLGSNLEDAGQMGGMLNSSIQVLVKTKIAANSCPEVAAGWKGSTRVIHRASTHAEDAVQVSSLLKMQWESTANASPVQPPPYYKMVYIMKVE